jgi:Fibronectin type III domain/Calcineurin-like phosphoesterase
MRVTGRATLAGLAALAVSTTTGCRERAARFIGVDAAPLPGPSAPLEEPDQVHFTFAGPTTVTFSWRGNGRSLSFWSTDMAPRTVEAHTPSPKPFSTPGTWQEATVTNLRPGTEYDYEVGRPRSPVSLSLHTPPGPGASGFTFVATAGLGASIDSPEVGVTQRLIALAEPVFVLALGDLTFGDIRSQDSVDRHFTDAMAWSGKAAYMPVWGEHEWQTPNRDDLRNYKGRFALPNAHASPGAPAAGCCGEDWYWFDFGNVRFISYPEPYTDDAWDDWAVQVRSVFEAAEASAGTTFIVTMGHRAAYSSAAGGGAARLRILLDAFGARYPKYVLNLTGHGGVYERTTPQARVTHVTAGGGGGDLPHADTPCAWPECTRPTFSAYRAIHHGFLRLVSRPTSLKLEAICGAAVQGRDDLRCAEGEIFDSVEIPAGLRAKTVSASAR